MVLGSVVPSLRPAAGGGERELFRYLPTHHARPLDRKTAETQKQTTFWFWNSTMTTNFGDHAYASLTSPDGKRRKTSLTMLEELDLATVSYHNSQESCEQVAHKPNEMQAAAIAAAANGDNLFLTGRAGTGKSWTIEQIVNYFTAKNLDIHVMAPTGIAAIAIDGETINSWGKFCLGEYCKYTSASIIFCDASSIYAMLNELCIDKDFQKMMDESIRYKIRKANALLIDEISMVNGQLFDVLECMIAIIRDYDGVKEKLKPIQDQTEDNNVIMSDLMLKMRWDNTNGLGFIPPWGGLQIIVVGDFFQLPPVASGNGEPLYSSAVHTPELDLKVGRQGCYAFESRAWKNSNMKTIELVEVRRQSDEALYNFLNDMRVGLPNFVSKHKDVIHALQNPLPQRDGGIIPTEVHPKNAVVDEKNKRELDKLPGDCIDFPSTDKVQLAYEFIAKFLDKHGCSNFSDLSYENLVSSLKRRERIQLENEMKSFKRHADETFFKCNDSRVAQMIELKKDSQVMLLWNLDISHKLANGSRGIIKEFVDIEEYAELIQRESKRREDKMQSSASSQEEKKDDNLDAKPDKLLNVMSSCDKETAIALVEFVSNLGEFRLKLELSEMEEILQSDITDLPFVHFLCGAKRLIRPQAFEKEYKKLGTATRWQIPLTLAWAVTIHKSQGMTIDYLSVGKCFEASTNRNWLDISA